MSLPRFLFTGSSTSDSSVEILAPLLELPRPFPPTLRIKVRRSVRSQVPESCICSLD
jgi:hypothetical protein